MWTQFWDMHSGGRTKEGDYEKIYIEAPEAEAEIIFYNRFGHSPHRVSCTCCGSDYSVSESVSLEDATGYHRGCATAYFDKDGKETDAAFAKKDYKSYTSRYVDKPSTEKYAHKYIPLADYLAEPTTLVIYAADIKDDERHGTVPEQGYVWQD